MIKSQHLKGIHVTDCTYCVLCIIWVVQVEDVSLTVGVGGKTGSEIFDRVRGINLLLRRPLRDLWHKVPVIEATVKVCINFHRKSP